MSCGLCIHVVYYIDKYILGQMFQKKKMFSTRESECKILFIFSRVEIIVTYVYSQTAKLCSSTYTSDLLNMKVLYTNIDI